MKKFLFHIAVICITIIGVLFLADYSYTEIYNNSKPRNKIALAYLGEAKKYDVIFLGSSRANNHFVPNIFIERGFKAYNYGMSGSRLEESALLLELLLEKGTKIKNLVVEVDLNINSNGYSEGTRILFYPFLRKSNTIRSYYKNIPEFDQLYYFPFYKYIKNDAKIGARELFFTATQKPSHNMELFGFSPLEKTGKKMQYDLSRYHPKRNKGYEKIKELCKIYNVNIIAVTTPMCENTKNIKYFDDVVKLYPEIYNLEDVITDESCFSSCGHMNEKGAKKFTLYLLNRFFK
ncbi:hypothetical protein [Flavobacterium soli]|uniref:hypothetical protein n=1 Tax=Flavobacterium soli TaxID=344881 RepID=UPI0004083772|nr:hypothetical protein [Flavobacterium soli]